eukprot:RCo025835
MVPANVFTVRASYLDEINALVNYATYTLDLIRFSVFYQGDSFGIPAVGALKTALAAVNLRLYSNGSCGADSTNVTAGTVALVSRALPFVPEVILVWASAPAAAAFISLAKTLLPSSVVYLVGSVVGDGFGAYLSSGNSRNIYMAQVLPLSTDVSVPVVGSYQTAMAAVNATYTPSAISLE